LLIYAGSKTIENVPVNKVKEFEKDLGSLTTNTETLDALKQ
jgi:hypothetical protein